MKSLIVTAQDTYQLLSGSPYLPVSSRRLQLRSKRFPSSRGNSTGGNNSHSWLLWRGSASVNTICGVVVLVPWLTLILLTVLLWRSRLHGGLPLAVRDIPGGRQCLGWKETFFCHPFA